MLVLRKTLTNKRKLKQAFRPEDKKRGSSPGRSNNDEQALQTSSQRTYLRGKYAATKLYQVVVDVVPGDHLELNLRVGDVVGVIQQKDPMGNRNRWFCDNGIAQGFLDAAVLSPLGHSPESGDIDKTCQAPEERQPRHSLDSIKPLQNQLSDGCHTKGKLIAVVAPYDEVNEDDGKKPIRPAPPVPVNKARRRDPEQLSQHSYEEIAAEELQSTINDLSPIYEEIPGGSRSSMSSGSGSHSPRGRFYYAVYGFSPEAEEKTMLHIDKGQVLRVLQVAGEWWYVEDRARSRGYVPATYLKPYTA